jgi:hypothetical protein
VRGAFSPEGWPVTGITEARRQTMTDPSAPAPPAGEDAPQVDVWSLAGQPPPPGARWLVVTAADGEPGGTYTARPCPGPLPQAFGGDVLICLEPGMDGPPGPGIKVAVQTVARERLVCVADWQMAGTSAWPERILGTVIFTMSAMTELGERADLGELAPVDLTTAGASAVTGLPSLAGDWRPVPLP